jgi:hypothetical protein
LIACGNVYPSYIGVVYVTPSPDSTTIPVTLPLAYNDASLAILT